LVRKLLNLNSKKTPIDVVLLSRNSADTGLRIFNSIEHYDLNILSMFYAQCDNKGSMYKLAVKVIDDVNSARAGSHLHSHGIYFY
jgi:hypothetical protein